MDVHLGRLIGPFYLLQLCPNKVLDLDCNFNVSALPPIPMVTQGQQEVSTPTIARDSCCQRRIKAIDKCLEGFHQEHSRYFGWKELGQGLCFM